MDNTLSCGRLLSNIKQCTIDIYSNIDESPIMDRRRVWGRTDTCKSMVESLYYWTETVTTLPISYCCSVTRSYPTIYSFMNCSMPGFPALHYLPEFAQTHVHWVSDAIQPSHPLWPPTPLAFNLSQHWSLFQCVGSFHQVTKGLELQLQHQSFQ